MCLVENGGRRATSGRSIMHPKGQTRAYRIPDTEHSSVCILPCEHG